jgi:hypothetical protein
VETNDKPPEEEIEIELDDDEEEELFNFDEGSPPRPKFKNKQMMNNDESKESEVVPAPFLAYVLMYFAKVCPLSIFILFLFLILK